MPRRPRGRSPVRDGLLFGPEAHGRSMDVSTVETLTTGKGSARNRLPRNFWRTKKGCGAEKGKEKVPTPDPVVSTGAKQRAGLKEKGCKVAKVCPACTSKVLSHEGITPWRARLDGRPPVRGSPKEPPQLLSGDQVPSDAVDAAPIATNPAREGSTSPTWPGSLRARPLGRSSSRRPPTGS